MRALVTAELTDDGEQRLRALGYDVLRAGWGTTRQALDRDAYVAAAQGCSLLVTEIEVVDAEVLAALPDRLRAAQQVFDRTGGLHAAGLFTADGELLVLREDVGRHNAVDKVVGWALREGRLPLTGTVLLVSGRASFELTQKAWMAGVPLLAAVSAPSSLAADLADEAGMTLVGFLRGTSMNVYAHDRRVARRGADPTPG